MCGNVLQRMLQCVGYRGALVRECVQLGWFKIHACCGVLQCMLQCISCRGALVRGCIRLVWWRKRWYCSVLQRVAVHVAVNVAVHQLSRSSGS